MIIGEIKISPPIVLAPMAGVTSQPFRILAKEFGCGLVVSEMISARGLKQLGKRGRSLLYYTAAERPISFQLFGSDPRVLAEGAKWVEDWGADIIDLNFGCPTPKIVRNGDGGALLKDPSLCSNIFQEVARAVNCPVTVKMRLSWDAGALTAVEIARRAEAAGIAAVTVHGRTVSQGYRGKADWSAIKEVAEAVLIPVIGNGDISSPHEASAALNYSNCSGVMIGRAAMGNPWIFLQIRAWLEEKKILPPPSDSDILQVVLRHLAMLSKLKGESIAVPEMRRHTSWYLKGLPGAAEIRRRLVQVTSASEMESILRELLGSS